MTEQQGTSEDPAQRPETAPVNPNRKWIALAVGGGCALVACVVLVVVLIVGLLVPRVRTSTNPPTPLAEAATVDTGVQQSGNTMGDPAAPVKIVEYADFQCPYCMHYWQNTEPQIIDKYVKTGKVHYEYRSVGDFLGEESQNAAEAAYCAADQGKFWQYHDTLFQHWTGENVGDFTPDKLKQYAAALGLDQQSFDSCLDGHDKAARVSQDLANARTDGIRATPSFLVDGKLIEGAPPFDQFQQVIEEALQGK